MKDHKEKAKWFRKFTSGTLKPRKSHEQVAYYKDKDFEYVKEEMLDKISKKTLTPEEVEKTYPELLKMMRESYKGEFRDLLMDFAKNKISDKEGNSELTESSESATDSDKDSTDWTTTTEEEE